MVEYFRKIVIGQFEAALCMLEHAVRACPPEHWEGKIANGTFRWAAYHTLFWGDLYLSPGDEGDFALRELNLQGGDERQDAPTAGLSQAETLRYVEICRAKMRATIASESAEVLQAPSAISFRKITRGELHLYNLRHVQHHVGQLSAYLRRVHPAWTDRHTLPWIEMGWK